MYESNTLGHFFFRISVSFPDKWPNVNRQKINQTIRDNLVLTHKFIWIDLSSKFLENCLPTGIKIFSYLLVR